LSKSDDWDRKEKDLEGYGHGGKPPRKPGQAFPNYWSNPFYRAQRAAIQGVMRINFYVVVICGMIWLMLGTINIDQYIPFTITLGAVIGYGITFVARFLLDRKWRNYQGGPLPL